MTGRTVLDAVRTATPGLDVRWAPSLADVADVLAAELRPGDLCLSIGAGDVTTVADLVQARRGAGGGA